jgi:lysophospholipase L1-like esterase
VTAPASQAGLDCAAEHADPYCAPFDELTGLVAGASWTRFGVLGDSLAKGLGTPLAGYRTANWCERVCEVLATTVPHRAYLNTGVKGALAGQVLDDQLGRMLEFGPDLVALTAGGNDMFGPRFHLPSVESVVDAIVGQLRAGGADVIMYALMDIGAVFPRLAAIRPRMIALNDRMRALAHRHDAIFIDMFAHPAARQRDAYSPDMIHASMRGHAVLATETVRALAARLRRSVLTGPDRAIELHAADTRKDER